MKLLLPAALLAVATPALAVQVLSSTNLTVDLLHCHGKAQLILTDPETPQVAVHSNRCRYVGQEDGPLTEMRGQNIVLKKGDVKLISVQSPDSQILDSFLVDTRQK